MKYATLMLLCLTIPTAYAKNGVDSINQSQQKSQYENQFNTETFAKCNVCHKPLESTVVGSRTIPSYIAMSRMEQDAINNGIEHGGHLTSDEKSGIYSVIHPVIQPAIQPALFIHNVAEHKNKSKNNAAKKTHRTVKKHGKSKKRKHSRLNA